MKRIAGLLLAFVVLLAVTSPTWASVRPPHPSGDPPDGPDIRYTVPSKGIEGPDMRATTPPKGPEGPDR